MVTGIWIPVDPATVQYDTLQVESVSSSHALHGRLRTDEAALPAPRRIPLVDTARTYALTNDSVPDTLAFGPVERVRSPEPVPIGSFRRMPEASRDIRYLAAAGAVSMTSGGDLAEDRSAGIWSVSHRGLSHFDGQTLRRYTRKHGLPDRELWCVQAHVATGEVWLGSNQGLTVFDGERFRYASWAQDVDHGTVFSAMQASDGEVWFGTWGQFYRCAGDRILAYDIEHITRNYVSAMVKRGRDSTWLATNTVDSRPDRTGGLLLVTDTSLRCYTPAHGLASPFITALLRDRTGNLWIGYRNGGLDRFDGRDYSSASIGRRAFLPTGSRTSPKGRTAISGSPPPTRASIGSAATGCCATGGRRGCRATMWATCLQTVPATSGLLFCTTAWCGSARRICAT